MLPGDLSIESRVRVHESWKQIANSNGMLEEAGAPVQILCDDKASLERVLSFKSAMLRTVQHERRRRDVTHQLHWGMSEIGGKILVTVRRGCGNKKALAAADACATPTFRRQRRTSIVLLHPRFRRTIRASYVCQLSSRSVQNCASSTC